MNFFILIFLLFLERIFCNFSITQQFVFVKQNLIIIFHFFVNFAQKRTLIAKIVQLFSKKSKKAENRRLTSCPSI